MSELRLNRGYDPNPDDMPSYIDYCYTRMENQESVLQVTKVCIDKRTMDEGMSTVEEKYNFVRWLTKEDRDMVNRHLQRIFSRIS